MAEHGTQSAPTRGLGRRVVVTALYLVTGAFGILLVYAGIARSVGEFPYEQMWGVSILGVTFIASALHNVVTGRARRVAKYAAWGSLILFGLWLIFASQHGSMTRRALVTEGLSFASAAKAGVLDAFRASGRLPGSNTEAGLAPPEEISAANVSRIEVSEGGVITVTFGGSGQDRKLTGETIVLSPVIRAQVLDWDCRGGSMPVSYRPRSCR